MRLRVDYVRNTIERSGKDTGNDVFGIAMNQSRPNGETGMITEREKLVSRISKACAYQGELTQEESQQE